MIGRKRAKGIELIEKVAGRFDAMIEELDRGSSDCKSEQDENSTTIQQLQNRNGILELANARAQSIATNLRALIGG